MAADASAFAALGLEPGADVAAIDQAYKRLIKLHHPDREGGDVVRAAEINRAYRELRGVAGKDPLEFNEDLQNRREGMRWPLAALFAAFAVVMLLLIAPITRAVAPAAVGRLPLGHVAATAAPSDPMDQPLHLSTIDGAVRQALHLSRTKDEMALANASRDCQRTFRADPGLRQLDRCVAFDDAVIQLQDRDPLRDQGPFAELAVTGREWSAASALSNDYLAIDSRLDQIRLRVELALAPEIPPVAPAQNVVNVATD
jgi:hypothetical protein